MDEGEAKKEAQRHLLADEKRAVCKDLQLFLLMLHDLRHTHILRCVMNRFDQYMRAGIPEKRAMKKAIIDNAHRLDDLFNSSDTDSNSSVE